MKMQRVHAFTLIELLVVMSIISLLTALLLPSLASARQSAQTAQCLSQIRSLGSAIDQYATEFKNCLPTAYVRADNQPYPPSTTTTMMGSDTPMLGQFTNNPERAGAFGNVVGVGMLGGRFANRFPWICPSDSRTSINGTSYFETSYGLNAQNKYTSGSQTVVPAFLYVGNSGASAMLNWYDLIPRSQSIVSPAKFISFADSNSVNNMQLMSNIAAPQFIPNYSDRSTSYAVNGTESYANYTARHSGRTANWVFFDGHAVNLKEPKQAYDNGTLVLRRWDK